MTDFLLVLGDIEDFADACERERSPQLLKDLFEQTSLLQRIRPTLPEEAGERAHNLLGRLTILEADYPQYAHG